MFLEIESCSSVLSCLPPAGPRAGGNFPNPAQTAPEVYEARLDGKGELRRNVPGNFVLQFCLAYPLARGRPAVRARQNLVVLSCLSSASLPGARPSLAVLSCLPLARLDERHETRTVSRPSLTQVARKTRQNDETY